ncbi:MAG TPA: iron transporter, partial [Umezawaea sp.]|nr:iron transporter [Umezawaea sp.]
MRRLLALFLVCTTTACGATVAQDTSATDPVTVKNCGQDVTFDRVPSKVVTNDTGIAELMFALGLADRMAGYVIGSGQTADLATSPYKSEWDRVAKLGEKINKEVVQGASSDFVFAGWNYGFS